MASTPLTQGPNSSGIAGTWAPHRRGHWRRILLGPRFRGGSRRSRSSSARTTTSSRSSSRPSKIAQHRRSWDVGQDIRHPSHEKGLLEERPRAAGSLPPALAALDETGRAYFKLLAAGSRSVHRETLRLTFLVEVFGAIATAERDARGHADRTRRRRVRRVRHAPQARTRPAACSLATRQRRARRNLAARARPLDLRRLSP